MKRPALAAALLPILASASFAQSCVFTMPNVDLGSKDPSFSLQQTVVSFKASCTGVAGSTVRICPNFNAGSGTMFSGGNPRYMKNGATTLDYNIYSDSAFSTVWGSLTDAAATSPPTLSVTLNSTGNGTLTKQVYVRSSGTASVSGTYTSSFAGAETRVNYAYSTVGACTTISSQNRNPTQTPFTVTASSPGSCTIIPGAMNFGSRTLLNTQIDASSTFGFRCSAGLSYQIAMDGGIAENTGVGQREMRGASGSVKYSVYQDSARTIPWGNTPGVDTFAGVGGGTFQFTFPAYFRIPVQPTPPAGAYEDTIAITVIY